MRLFKKWLRGRCVSPNNNCPETDVSRAGYARVNPEVNSAPVCNSRSSTEASGGAEVDDSGGPRHPRRHRRSCKQLQLSADKSNATKPIALLDAGGGGGGCSRRIVADNSCLDPALDRPVDRAAGSDEAVSVAKARGAAEYGVKSIAAAQQLEYNSSSLTSVSINDDPDLNLSDYVIVNSVEEIGDEEQQLPFLDKLIHFGSTVEYGLTVEQAYPSKCSSLSAAESGSGRTAKSGSSSSSVSRRRAKLEVLDALNRSLMGPLYRAQKGDSLVDSQEIATPELEDVIKVRTQFGLSDAGNIIIDVGHIKEQRGESVYCKKRYQKFFTGADQAEEVSESTKFRLTWRQLIRRIIICLQCRTTAGHPRNKTVFSGPGESIGMYALSLADDTESTFSRNISNFISCTKESKAAPQVVMRNMRQFMSGMKNYLVKHGEGEFANEVQKARSQLKADEFLNLDSILEEVMHRLVILPLREHLYGLFVDYYTHSGDIQLLVEKVKQAAGRGPIVFGIKNTVSPPSPSALRQISALFVRLQETELPLEKLDLLLTAVSTIFEATSCSNGQQLSADDFLPVLVLVVAHCGFIGAEIEAEYMWGLIQPSLLSGEAGYYLTALCSAVHVLKNFSLHDHEGLSGSMELVSSLLPECSSVLRVIIPDECNGSIQTRTLPIRPHTTTREVCRIIAHKARITNAQDYGLFKLIDGEETLLQDSECPQDVRMAAAGRHCMIAYKRVDAKIAWPTAMPNSSTDNQ